MAKIPTVQQFFERFPTDDACLDHVMDVRYGREFECPKCERQAKFYRLSKEPAYTCEWCGHHVHPMAGTPFERTRTPLQKWFYAMYLFTASRHGVPAKELQRQLGVTYKTAWRMGHEIRKYMAIVDGDPGMRGHVEVDETLIGGRQPGSGSGYGVREKKTVVFGMVQRRGHVMTRVIPDVKRRTVERIIGTTVRRGSRISSDEHVSYAALSRLGYRHDSVNHSKDEYVRGRTHTNTIENFWAQLKRSIRGTHIHVSRKHLAKYLGEFEFRYNMRKRPEFMFDRLLSSF